LWVSSASQFIASASLIIHPILKLSDAVLTYNNAP